MIHKYIERNKDQTFILFHGTGGDENDLLPIAQFLEEDYNVLTIRGAVNENGALRYFKRQAHGQYDVEDLFARGKELAEFIKSASKEYGFDLSKAILVGFSNGANIAIHLLLEYPQLFNEGILMAPMYPLEIESVDLNNTHVFISTGKNDPLVSNEASEYVIQLFEENGAEVETYQVNSHEVTHGMLEAAKSWLNKK